MGLIAKKSRKGKPAEYKLSPHVWKYLQRLKKLEKDSVMAAEANMVGQENKEADEWQYKTE